MFDGTTLLEKIIVPTGFNPSQTIRELHRALKKDHEVYTVTTGYGRELLKEADKKVTEITCHGRGAAYLCPSSRAVIDIGGQDSKVIVMDQEHTIKDFLMNDKCAAGTGRFVEVIMRILHQDLCDLDQYVQGVEPTKISSMCAVFAESEVISLLAEDKEGASIARGVIQSICDRTAVFARRLPIEGSVFLSGGLASSEVIRSSLENLLGIEVTTHPLSQFTGAIGAAIIGYSKHTRSKDRTTKV